MSPSDEIQPDAENPTAAEAEALPGQDPEASAAADPLPAGHVLDPVTGQVRQMTFMERARQAAGQAAKVSVDVGGKAARAAGDVGGKAAKAAGEAGGKAAAVTAATIRDPATKARAGAALRKAKRGFTTALERIDPRILADIVVKATSLQERANASLKERGSAYRIGEITIGASIPPSIQFAIQRVDDPHHQLEDSTALLEKAAVADSADRDGAPASTTIVTLDGTEVDDADLDELDDGDENAG